jgi:hypothetical protein
LKAKHHVIIEPSTPNYLSQWQDNQQKIESMFDSQYAIGKAHCLNGSN